MKLLGFSAWLYRPYLDLGAVVARGPFHCHGPHWDIRRLVRGEELPRTQAVLMRSFREALVRQCELPEYALRDPRELEPALRTPDWSELCTCLERFDDLSRYDQLHTLWVLSKLCLYEAVIELAPPADPETGEVEAEIAFVAALAREVLHTDYQEPFDIGVFARIAEDAPAGSMVRNNAQYQVAVHAVRANYDVDTLEVWLKRSLDELAIAEDQLDPFTFDVIRSRHHRVAGFAPQMRRDVAGTEAEMALAEYHARRLVERGRERSTFRDEYELAGKETLFPALESRIKEAMWIEDYDLALRRAVELVELCPNEPRARLHLGQVYLERDNPTEALHAYESAAYLAPPGKEVALFMAGQCHEALGDEASAIRAYTASLHHDPQAVSSLERLGALQASAQSPHHFPHEALAVEWASEMTTAVACMEQANPVQAVRQYQGRQFDERADPG